MERSDENKAEVERTAEQAPETTEVEEERAADSETEEEDEDRLEDYSQ